MVQRGYREGIERAQRGYREGTEGYRESTERAAAAIIWLLYQVITW